MAAVSVVIITKNEADIIAQCVQKAKLITDDIVIIDNGSTDETLKIALSYGCRVFYKKWSGYGANKNKGLELAKYNWVLSIDADEIPDDELVTAINNLKLNNPAAVFDIKFKTYFGRKQIKYGTWGRDHHIRLFNRNVVKWSETPVHETLLLSTAVIVKKLNGCLHHYSVKNRHDCENKLNNYARLSAQKYFNNGRNATDVKKYLSPVFNFIKNYIVLLGFLDGKAGWQLAKILMKQTWLKYHYLEHLEAAGKNPQVSKPEMVFRYSPN